MAGSETLAAAGREAVMPPAPRPSHRRLKVFSLDPAADVQLEQSLISRSVLPVTWKALAPGPVGEYLEVVDVDPSSGCIYDPVDLNDPDLLAQDGLSPSSGNPQFHQQMVYAVGMKTIANFEQVLGRKILWAERRYDEDNRLIREPAKRYVRRLRIYPTLCATRTPTIRRRKGPCCSATSTPRPPIRATSYPAVWSSPACRTTSWRTR